MKAHNPMSPFRAALSAGLLLVASVGAQTPTDYSKVEIKTTKIGANTSWTSTHASRGCGQENLVSTGGAGLSYCFAVQ